MNIDLEGMASGCSYVCGSLTFMMVGDVAPSWWYVVWFFLLSVIFTFLAVWVKMRSQEMWVKRGRNKALE